LQSNLSVWPGRSEIHGVGLIAQDNFVPGEHIFRIQDYANDLFLDLDEVRKLPPWMHEFLPMHFRIEGKHVHIGRHFAVSHRPQLSEVMYMFLNSSDNPNAGLVYYHNYQVLHCLTPIKAGDEITINYAMTVTTLECLQHERSFGTKDATDTPTADDQ